MILLYSKWLALPINTRHEIAGALKIKKKYSTHVQDNRIVSDGYDIQDVENALSVKSLQTYLGVGLQEDNIEVLFDELIFRIENPDESRMDATKFKKEFTTEGLEQPKKDVKKTTTRKQK